MKLKFLIVIWFLPLTAMAEQRIVELVDGSQIRGEVISLEHGVYTIHNGAIGMIRLDEDRVASIRRISAPAAALVTPAVPPTRALGADAAAGTAMQSVQANIANNPGLMARIMQLQTDPQMQAILNDPEIMQAVQNFDFQALANNPKFKALMENARVRGVIDEAR